jgi:hypothetical protein
MDLRRTQLALKTRIRDLRLADRVGSVRRTVTRELRSKAFRRFGLVIFTVAFSLSGILAPFKEIKAASCVLQGNTITVDCEFNPGTYYYNGTFTVNSLVTVTAGNASSPGLVTIFADDFVVNGTISANGLGSAGAAGTCPGQPAPGGSDGNGGCHGGYGGRSSVFGNTTNVYGSATEPTALGSGGGDDNAVVGNEGGAGGGAVKIATYSATGMLSFGTLGAVTANGANAVTNQAGGGAGGSVWIDVGVLDVQDGIIQANGGNAGSSTVVGGGGGGRVAVHYASTSGIFTQSRQAFGGNRGTTLNMAAQVGGAGTIYQKAAADPNGSLVLDNRNMADSSAMTRLVSPTSLPLKSLAIRNDAHFIIPVGYDVPIDAGGSLTGGSAADNQPSLWIFGAVEFPSEAMTVAGLNIHQTGTIGRLKYLTFDNGFFGIDTSSADFSAGRGNRLETLTLSGTNSTYFSATSTTPLCVDVFHAKGVSVVSHATNTTTHAHSLVVSATTSLTIESTPP